ncbi:hypothetical protein [Deinococcus sp. UYEF24]
MTISPAVQTVQARFPEIVLATCVLGFAFLLAELIGYEHYQKGTQIIGLVSTIVGLLLALLGFVKRRAVRRTVLALLGLLTLTGLLGTYEHHETRSEDMARYTQQVAAGTAPKGRDGQTRKFESNIPTLAPLSLSGLAALAFLALLATPNVDARRVNDRMRVDSLETSR